MVEPAGKSRQTSSRTFFSAPAAYLKLTWSKETEPSRTSRTAWCGEAMVGFSSSTSPTRSTLVTARASSRKTLEIIMSEFTICST